MGLIRFAIENPVKIAVGVILLVLFGVLSLSQVRIQLKPDVDRPIVVVSTTWAGASPQEIESEIVDRQEEKLKNVTNLWKMTSTSSSNQATVKLEFPVYVDKNIALRDVSDKLRQVTGYPEEVDEPVITATDDDMSRVVAWMMLYAKSGDDVAYLKTFLEDNVKPILERADGIAEVSVYGGRDREIQVEIDPYLLASRGITMREVEAALRGQNRNISAGTILGGKTETSYRTVGEYRSLEQIEETVVAYKPGGPVRVRDIAMVKDDFKKPVSFVRSKGRKVIAMPARRETGANVIQAMDNLKVQIQLVNAEILEPRGLGLELTQVYDETRYIWSSIWLVVKNLFMGGALAIIVLTVFLRSSSAVGIITAAIPISIVGTLFVINLLGRSLNVVLLAGLAFAVGMVVDNAIVVLENIYRHRSMGKTRLQAATDGAHEVWGAVLASTLTTMAVFVPVITIQEEAGQLFKDIAIAISSAVALSLIVSVLVIPPLAARFFSATKATLSGDKPWWLASKVSAMVGVINQRVSSRVLLVALISFSAIFGSMALAPATEYMPKGNQNLVFGFLFSPPGYSIEEFDHMARIVEEGDPNDPTDGVRPMWEAELGSPEAAALPPVQIAVGKNRDNIQTVVPPPIDNFFFVSFSGGAFMGGTSKEPTVVKPLEQVLNRAGGRIPGVFTFFSQTSLFQSGGLRGGDSVDIELRSDNYGHVVSAAMLLQRKASELDYSRPNSSPQNIDLGRPEVQLVPDRVKAADLGLDANDVGFIVRACVDGAFVGEYNDSGDKIDLSLTVAGTRNAKLHEIGRLPIYTPTGDTVPIESAVKFNRTTAPQQINHIEQMKSVTLSIKPKTGVPLQETMRELEEDLIAPLREADMIKPDVISTLAGVANKLTQTQRAMIGDFRGTITQPKIENFPMWLSLVAALVILLVLAGLAGVLGGARTGYLTLMGGCAVSVLGFLALNPEFTLMLFQSRAFLALFLTYLLMAALFESFAYPFVIMFSVPLAAVGGFVALSIVHRVSLVDVASPIQQLDVLTMLGFVILIGIVVNNAILIVHQALTNMRRDHMESAEAVKMSVRTRTRPIFMSAMTSIFGMFPLVVMPGAGSELYRGLGSVVLGGLLVSTVFTLVVVPAVFTLFLDAQKRLAKAMERDESPGSVAGTAPALSSNLTVES